MHVMQDSQERNEGNMATKTKKSRGTDSPQPREQDLLMRKDGYITPREVAEAVGQNLATVHRALMAGTIPGIGLPVSETRTKWYVDIYKMLEIPRYAQSKTMLGNLKKLAALAGGPASTRKRAG